MKLSKSNPFKYIPYDRNEPLIFIVVLWPMMLVLGLFLLVLLGVLVDLFFLDMEAWISLDGKGVAR